MPSCLGPIGRKLASLFRRHEDERHPPNRTEIGIHPEAAVTAGAQASTPQPITAGSLQQSAPSVTPTPSEAELSQRPRLNPDEHHTQRQHAPHTAPSVAHPSDAGSGVRTLRASPSKDTPAPSFDPFTAENIKFTEYGSSDNSRKYR